MAGGRRPRAGTPLRHKHRETAARLALAGNALLSSQKRKPGVTVLAGLRVLVGRELALAALGLGSRHEASKGPIHPQTTRSPQFEAPPERERSLHACHRTPELQVTMLDLVTDM
jgi:hypothetical protein